jgi:hypothetical protein
MTEDVEMVDSPAGSEEQVTSNALESHPSERSMEKCDECRRRKKKCLPVDRPWPEGGKCKECEGAKLSCGPNGRHKPPTDGEQSDTDVGREVPTSSRYGSAVGQISESQWNQVRDAFTKLYMQESLSLKKVMGIMQESYSFYATPKQWQTRIAKWGLKKYGKGLSSGKGTSSTSSPSVRHADENIRWLSSSVEPTVLSRMLPPRRRIVYSTSAERLYSPDSSTGRSPSQPASARNRLNMAEVWVIPAEVTSEFVYPWLPTARSIRLLQLKAGSSEEPIRAELLVVDLDTTGLSYQALSYCWGDSEDMEIVLLGGSPFQVRRNLEEILHNLRHQSEDITLWIDAICINHQDKSEKARQIPLMPDIYARATLVVAWLGSETAERSAAMEFAHKCAELESIELLLRAPATSSMRESFRTILRSPWFRRTWVVQELIFSKSCILHFGRSSIFWTEFVGAIEVIMTFEQSTDTTIFSWTAQGLSHEFFEELNTSSVMQLISVTKIVARRDQKGKVFELNLSLEVLLYKCRFLETNDPRDHINALAPLSSKRKGDDTHRNPPSAFYAASTPADTPSSSDAGPESMESSLFLVDYHKSLSTLCREVVEFIVRTSESIDIICRPWAPYWDEHPTWISTLDKDSFKLTRSGTYTRFQADALVGEPGQILKSYNASSKSRAQCQFSQVSGHSILIVHGFLLDYISQVGSAAMEGCIPADWLSLKEDWQWDIVSMLPPESFWRTLVADRDNMGESSRASSFFASACKWIFNEIVPGGNLDTNKILRESKSPPYVVSFLRRVQAVIWMRRLFITEQGYIGMGPEQVQRGDSVHILLGCSVPVVLRKVMSESLNDYHIIGDSYVHGVMEGEACGDTTSFSEIWLR